MRLAEARKKVAVVPGTAFGPSGEGYVRACYATSLPQIKTALGLIGDFCREVGGCLKSRCWHEIRNFRDFNHLGGFYPERVQLVSHRRSG